ncbi:MAG: hypothetical protein ACFCVH_02670 [Alphaproteobacteria bacterium]
MKRIGTAVAIVGLGIGLAACQSGSGGSATTATATPSGGSPTTSAPAVPGEPVGDRLREILAGSSASGQASCSYFGADGALVRRAGGAVQSGTWAVDGRFVCETVGAGTASCYTLDFLPLGGANMTPATGSSAPAQSVQIAAGNSCG